MTYWRSSKWIQTCSHQFFTCRPRNSGIKQSEVGAVMSHLPVGCLLPNICMEWLLSFLKDGNKFKRNPSEDRNEVPQKHTCSLISIFLLFFFFFLSFSILSVESTIHLGNCLLSCKHGIHENTEVLTLMQNHLS